MRRVWFVGIPDETIQKLDGRIQKDDAFIPEEEWSKPQEINKYEISLGEMLLSRKRNGLSFKRLIKRDAA